MNDSSTSRILVVEDEKSLLHALRQKLTDAGYIVDACKNGKEALEVSTAHNPDLVLADILVPVMDGINMLKEIRTKSWGQSIPVIILTNIDNQVEISAQASELYVNKYLIKADSTLEEVVDKVSEVLHHR